MCIKEENTRGGLRRTDQITNTGRFGRCSAAAQRGGSEAAAEPGRSLAGGSGKRTSLRNRKEKEEF